MVRSRTKISLLMTQMKPRQVPRTETIIHQGKMGLTVKSHLEALDLRVHPVAKRGRTAERNHPIVLLLLLNHWGMVPRYQVSAHFSNFGGFCSVTLRSSVPCEQSLIIT